MLLFVVPCLVIFFVELSQKLAFMKMKGVVIAQRLRVIDSAEAKILLAYTAAVVSWCIGVANTGATYGDASAISI